MSKLEKEFVLHTESLELKKLGFNEPCLMCYRGESGLYSHSIGGYASEMTLKSNTDLNTYSVNEKEDYWVAAPTFSQAFRWFREKYNYWSYVYPSIRNKTWHFHIQFYDSDMWGEMFLGENYTTYEEAELACLKKLIEICCELK